MTREISRESQKIGTSQNVALPAPNGGLNTRDVISDMPVTDAQIMENYIPETDSVITRWGFEPAATGASSNIETLLSYESGTVSELISSSGSVVFKGINGTLTSIGTGFANARWEGANFNGNLLMVNGADTPQKFDGSTLSAMTITGSGLTPSDLDGVNVFKNFVFYWDSDAQDFWYGALDAIEGAFTKFPLSRVGSFGGNLVKIETWNIDGGDGVDDLAVFFMSSGDAIAYQGTDPGDASAWALVGVYKIGAPIHKRAINKVGNDIAIVNNSDFVYFSEIVKNGGVITSSSKLSGAISKAAINNNQRFGWQVMNYPRGNMFIINVPLNTNSKYEQYIVNTITGAGAKFTGIDARVWVVHKSVLYFGGNTILYKADTGHFKDDTLAIKTDVMQAYSTFGIPYDKTFNTIAPIHAADGNVLINVDMNYDFKRTVLAQAISSESTGTPWGSPWGSPWSPEDITRSTTFLTQGQGKNVAIRLKSSVIGQRIKWYATYYNFSVNAI